MALDEKVCALTESGKRRKRGWIREAKGGIGSEREVSGVRLKSDLRLCHV